MCADSQKIAAGVFPFHVLWKTFTEDRKKGPSSSKKIH